MDGGDEVNVSVRNAIIVLLKGSKIRRSVKTFNCLNLISEKTAGCVSIEGFATKRQGNRRLVHVVCHFLRHVFPINNILRINFDKEVSE